ncbi:MAG: hypothetical protein IPH03_01555 [Tetrasphaera sp.]|nr:hypothetical protein [Tetrasphaera sp.]
MDYGLMRDGDLLGEPFHYRDERRCAEGPRAVHERLDHAEPFSRHGPQFLPLHHPYQLAADPLRAREADRFLLIPDLLGYWLTGRAVAERTNASTTGLLERPQGSGTTTLSAEPSCRAASFRYRRRGRPVGTISGGWPLGREWLAYPLVRGFARHGVRAVVGGPLEGEDAAYISLGTWGLVGVELAPPGAE